MFLHVCGWFIQRVCRENSETKDGAIRRRFAYGRSPEPTEEANAQKVFMERFSASLFFETVSNVKP